MAAFTRDGFRCRRTCEICFGQGNEPNAPVANPKNVAEEQHLCQPEALPNLQAVIRCHEVYPPCL
jgi:hypothetical protein